MNITDIRVRLNKVDNSVKAFASITFDGAFVIHDIKIIETDKGRFIAMPSRKAGDSFIDIAHPINQSARDELQAMIFEKYDAALAESEAGSAES